MSIEIIGSMSSYQMCYVSTWIKEHLTTFTMIKNKDLENKPYYVCGCKIKLNEGKIVVECDDN